ncbi:hypothetical protein K3495_g12330 [Podosphaera aphanis]|nr:hypothetical protein K3495_g12330 [Podosphaera aphanis]
MRSFAILTVLPILFWSAIGATSIEKIPSDTSRSTLSKRAHFMTENEMVVCHPGNPNRRYFLYEINLAANSAKTRMRNEQMTNPAQIHLSLRKRLRGRNIYPIRWRGTVHGFQEPFMEFPLTKYIGGTRATHDLVILDRNYQVAEVRDSVNKLRCEKVQIIQQQIYIAPPMPNRHQRQYSSSSSTSSSSSSSSSDDEDQAQSRRRILTLPLPHLSLSLGSSSSDTDTD